jgi:hypothetical protein
VEGEVVGILVLRRQAMMQLLEAMPTDAPLVLLKGFLFPDQNAQGLAIQRKLASNPPIVRAVVKIAWLMAAPFRTQ